MVSFFAFKARKHTITTNYVCIDIVRQYNFDNMTSDDLDDVFDKLTSELSNISKRLPRSKYRKHIRPYWNEELSGIAPRAHHAMSHFKRAVLG